MMKPNIIYFNSHDTGRYVQPFGTGFKSPNIQALAEDGCFFRNAHTLNPTCSASRSSLVTSMYPHKNGMLGLSHRGWSLNDYNDHMLHRFKENGYETVLCGLQHVSSDVDIIGYDRIYSQSHTNVKAVLPNAIEYMNKKHDKPFYLEVGFAETHLEYLRDDMGKSLEDKEYLEETSKYLKVPTPLPDTKEIRTLFAEFQMSLDLVDNALGKIVKKLKELGIYDNTIIICTTDHGLPMPYMKCTLTDHGTGVNLIIKEANTSKKGQVIDTMVTHMDILPTLCDMIKIPKPDNIDGLTLKPLMDDKVDKVHDVIFAQVNFHAGYEPKRSVRTNRYKYIKRFDDKESKNVFVNVDMSEAKKLWLENGWLNQSICKEYLYDLVFDPNEINNLAHDDEYQSILYNMRGKLDVWMIDNDDPLLNGQLKHTQRVNSRVSRRGAIHVSDEDSTITGTQWNEIENL